MKNRKKNSRMMVKTDQTKIKVRETKMKGEKNNMIIYYVVNKIKFVI